MTLTKAPNQKEIIDWQKKSADDSARIGKRMSGRDELSDAATTANNAAPTRPQAGSDKALQRLRQKIKEVYDDEDEDEKTPEFFNISLLGEENTSTESEAFPRREMETIRITKEQQLAGKLNTIMSSSMAAKEAGLSPQATAADARLANSAEYDLKKIRRQTLKQKISDPLQLKGDLKEKTLPQAVHGLKNAERNLPEDTLAGYPAEAAPELNKENSEAELAKLILQKSGRGAPRKKLSELAQSSPDTPENLPEKNNGKENA